MCQTVYLSSVLFIFFYLSIIQSIYISIYGMLTHWELHLDIVPTGTIFANQFKNRLQNEYPISTRSKCDSHELRPKRRLVYVWEKAKEKEHAKERARARDGAGSREMSKWAKKSVKQKLIKIQKSKKSKTKSNLYKYLSRW